MRENRWSSSFIADMEGMIIVHCVDDKNRMYLIDRRFDFYSVKDCDLTEQANVISGTMKKDVIDVNKATVLDGELLIETKEEKPYVFHHGMIV